MRQTSTIHRILPTLLPALAISLLLAVTTTAIAQRRHKQPAKLAANQPNIALLDPTDTQTLIQCFGAVQSPAFTQWLHATLPPPMAAKDRDEAFPRAAWS